jgi:hypothetical protein
MKVIGIGFHKTGTSTLDLILSKLGYKVLDYRVDLAEDLFKNDFSRIFKLTDSHDAFEDNPWAVLYKELDERYPNSKFIVTTRDEEKWLKSMINHFGDADSEMRRWIYGVGHPKGNEDVFLERYRRHYKEVGEYFKDRPDDIIWVSWGKGDGWEKICSFLSQPIPSIPFPHANKRSYKKKKSRPRFIKLKTFLYKVFSPLISK